MLVSSSAIEVMFAKCISLSMLFQNSIGAQHNPMIFRYIFCKTVHKSLEYWLVLDTVLLFSNFLKCEALIFKRHSAPNLLPVFFSSAYLTLRWRCNIYACIHCSSRECSRGGCDRLCWVDWRNVLQCKRERKMPTTLKQETPVPSVQFRPVVFNLFHAATHFATQFILKIPFRKFPVRHM